MQRAMGEAEDESNDEVDSEDAWGGFEDESEAGETSDRLRVVSTSSQGTSEATISDYLPDAIFAAAAKSTKRRFFDESNEDDDAADEEFDQSRHRRRRVEPAVRDVIIGWVDS